MDNIINMELFNPISQIIAEARNTVKNTVNRAMVLSYWNIGRLIVEDEQQGKQRAEYGKAVLKELSVNLTEKFGMGFEVSNLRRMRKFYISFPKQGAVRPVLSWIY